MIVTGPTVVGPLVRRLRVAPKLALLLEAEGVFVDAIGATIAVVALEIALGSPSPLGTAVIGMIERLGTGIAIGSAFGLLLGAALRKRGLVPQGMENILALAIAVACYQVSQAVVAESGISAAIAAGLVVGNMRIRRIDDLAEFKEQLTVLLIGLLFVLLAADVRIADVMAIGPGALVVVALLMLVVRPLMVWLATAHSNLGWREKIFVAWVGPRGIVAAAVATVFASALERHGLEGGTQLRALVFVVIAVTVTVQGLGAGPLASLLGLRRAANTGYLFLGATPIAIHIAERFAQTGVPVELIDTSAENTQAAERAGLKVIYGNGFDPRTLAKARIDTRSHIVALTSSESINMLFAQRVSEQTRERRRLLVAIDPSESGVSPEMVHKLGGTVMFGRGTELDAWLVRWRHGEVAFARWMYVGNSDKPEAFPDGVLPLWSERNGAPRLFDDGLGLREGDVVSVAVARDALAAVEAWLAAHPWSELSEARTARPSRRPTANPVDGVATATSR